MIRVYAIVSPGNDLDGETFFVQATTVEQADAAAAARVADTFSIASPSRKAQTSFRVVAQYTSRREMDRAESADTSPERKAAS